MNEEDLNRERKKKNKRKKRKLFIYLMWVHYYLNLIDEIFFVQRWLLSMDEFDYLLSIEQDD